MSGIRAKWVVGLAVMLALVLASSGGLSTAFAQGGPTRVSGGGEAIAAAFVTYNKLTVGTQNVPSIATIGNRITFGFNAHVDKNGNVRGRMQLVDHDLDLVIHSDVAVLVPHPTLGAPVGFTGTTFKMASSTGGAVVNGESGWRLENSPLFDGGEGQGAGDTVCFELFNAAGIKVRQWSAFLSSGNVQIVP